MDKYAKKNISAKQSQKSEKARIQGENENRRRAQRNQAAAREGSQETDTVSLLDFRLPKEMRIRKRRDFQRVYTEGRRIKGRFMTAFVLPSETSFQRVGVTATKRAIGNSVKRNRAKRLLREAFRLNKPELVNLETKYDWVLNARGDLLKEKLEKPLEEFREIVLKLRGLEAESKQTDSRERKTG